MRDADSLNDPVRPHLLGYRKHCAYKRHRKTRLLKFLAHHSAAATAGPSRGDEEHALHSIVLQVGADLLSYAAHDCGRALIARNDEVGRIKSSRTNPPFRLQRTQRIQ